MGWIPGASQEVRTTHWGLQQAHLPPIAILLRWPSPRCPLIGAAGGSWTSRWPDSDTESRRPSFGSSGTRTAATSGCLISVVPNRRNGAPGPPTSGGNYSDLKGTETGSHLLVRACGFKNSEGGLAGGVWLNSMFSQGICWTA